MVTNFQIKEFEESYAFGKKQKFQTNFVRILLVAISHIPKKQGKSIFLFRKFARNTDINSRPNSGRTESQ